MGAAAVKAATEASKRKARGATARKKAKRHPRAQGRSAVPKNYWRREASPLRHVGEEQFRLWTYRRGARHLALGAIAPTGRHWGGLVEQVTWDDVSAILTGELTLRSDPGRKVTVDVVDGDEVRLESRKFEGAKWREVWRMRCSNPAFDFSSGTITLALANDLALLNGSVDDFDYSLKGKRKHGWLVHDAIADVCRRYGMRYHLVKTRHRIKKQGIGRRVNVWEFVKKLRNYEATATGRKLVLRYENGALTMRPLRRSPQMLLLGPTLVAASLQRQRNERFATSLTIRTENWDQKAAKGKKGHKRQKPRKAFAYYTNRAATKRYGHVHRIVYSPDAESSSELRHEGKLFVAEVLKPLRTVSITHPAIPTLRRGDSMTIRLVGEGLRQIVFAKEIHFRLGAGEFFMDVACVLEDPFVDARDENILDKLADIPSPRWSERKPPAKKKRKKKKPKPNQQRTAKKPAAPKETPGQNLSRRYGG